MAFFESPHIAPRGSYSSATSSSTHVISIDNPTAITVGNTLVVAIVGTIDRILTVSDDAGNSWSHIETPTDSANTKNYVAWCEVTNGFSAGDEITLSFNADTDVAAIVDEFTLLTMQESATDASGSIGGTFDSTATSEVTSNNVLTIGALNYNGDDIGVAPDGSWRNLGNESSGDFVRTIEAWWRVDDGPINAQFSGSFIIVDRSWAASVVAFEYTPQQIADPSTYEQHALARQPRAYWRLDETSGSTAADEKNAHDGTYINSPTLGQPPLIQDGTSVEFNGTDEIVSVDSVSRILTHEFSIGVWLNLNTISGTQPRYFSTSTSGGNIRLSCSVEDDGTVSVTHPDLSIETSAGVISFNQTHFVVFTLEQATGSDYTARIYVDGVEEVSATWSRTIEGTSFATIAGELDGNFDPVDVWDGALDEVIFYQHALTSADVSELHQAGSGDDSATFDATLATAAATGLDGTVTAAQTATFDATLGTASATGLSGEVAASQAATLNATVATATATGLPASSSVGVTFSATLATSTASGLDATVAGKQVAAFDATLATSTATGLDAVVISAPIGTFDATLATATATALPATITAQRVVTLDSSPATAVAVGLAAELAGHTHIPTSVTHPHASSSTTHPHDSPSTTHTHAPSPTTHTHPAPIDSSHR